jgi:hypothetical protein
LFTDGVVGCDAGVELVDGEVAVCGDLSNKAESLSVRFASRFLAISGGRGGTWTGLYAT